MGNPARIEIDPTTTAIQQGSAVSFQATYYDTLGNIIPGTSFQWLSSDTSISSIDENGFASGNQPGQVMIVAAANGVESEPALLTVVSDPNQVAKVSVVPDSGSIRVGETQQYLAAAFNLNNDRLVGKVFSWRSSDPSIATIDNSGLLSAIEPGTVDIIASTDGIDSHAAFLEILGESRTGMFMESGTSYTVRGTVLLETLENGSLMLQFGSDFSSSNGPGLHVFLSTANRINSGSLDLGEPFFFFFLFFPPGLSPRFDDEPVR
ncbi:Ig-like domain-containing protein [candidate division KSB1 bacterium]|nr:Ig-like domain-containing protein [candidate division KSB1 bacterium]